MVQILPKVPGFGETIGANLGAGLGAGFNKAAEFAQQMQMEKAKARQGLELYNEMKEKRSGQGAALSGKEKEKKYIELIPKLEERHFEATGEYFTPENLDEIWQNFDQVLQATGQGLQMPEQEDDPFEEAEIMAALGKHDLSRVASDKAKAQIKGTLEERKFNTERSNKFLDKIEALSDSLGERKVALQSAMSAVESGQITPLGGDFWADALGMPQLRTASGGQLQTSAKVNLMGSLGKIGARPNQFIEKQIDSAFSKAGEKPTVQKAKLMITKSVLDLDEKYAELADEIANQDRQAFGYVKEDVASRTKKMLKPYVEEVMEKLSYDLQDNMEKELDPLEFKSIKKVPIGTPLTIEKASIIKAKASGDTEEEKRSNAEKIARKAGYKIMPDRFYEALL